MSKDIRSSIEKRKGRIRARLSGTKARPRLAVFRSLKHIAIQVIDDVSGRTLVSATDRELDKKIIAGKKPIEIAQMVGELVARKALEANVKEVVFDRGGGAYHGRIKAVAESARTAGLIF